MGLFDSPSHLLILLVVVLVLFGAKRLPSSARALGQAMRAFKAETREFRKEQEQEPTDEPTAPQQIAPQHISASAAPLTSTGSAPERSEPASPADHRSTHE